MLSSLLLSLLIVSSVFIIYQDLKDRQISWYLFPACFILTGLLGLQKITFAELSQYFLVNFLILILHIALLFLYFFIKYKTIRNIIDSQIGIGDLLFFLVLAVGFSPLLFCAVFVFSLIFSLLIYIITIRLKPNTRKEIPLAAYMAFVFIPIKLVDTIFSLNFSYNDGLIAYYF